MNLYNKTEEQLRGTFGLIYEENEKKEDDEAENPLDALKWLKKNNPFYFEFVSACERIENYLSENPIEQGYNGFPATNSTIIKQKDGILELRLNNKSDVGLVINVDDRKTHQYVDEMSVLIGLTFKKAGEKIEANKVYLTDPDVEPKIFPHLFPDAQYFRNRLLNIDPRCRNDKYYLFYAYDRLTRERIFAVNGMIKARSASLEGTKQSKLTRNNCEEYFEYGNWVPKCITGSKAYWKSKYYDLISIINVKGIFGEIEHYWRRIECQNRGALHAHMLLWTKNKPLGVVRADIPDGNDENGRKLKNSKCKYGFPFQLCDNDHISADGCRYYYKRVKKEDQLVVPYNASLLLLWGGHVNVQYVTERGIEQYLAKYVSKIEPTFSTVKQTEISTEVRKYFQCRVVSSVEASALVMGHHFVQSNVKVTFIATCFPQDQFKFLRTKKELTRLDPDDDDIFKHSAYDYYLQRPVAEKFSTINLFDYHQKYEIFVKQSTKKILKSRCDNVFNDQLGNQVPNLIFNLRDEIKNRFIADVQEPVKNANNYIFDDLIIDDNENDCAQGHIFQLEPSSEEFEFDNLLKVHESLPDKISELERKYINLSSCQKMIADYVQLKSEEQHLIFVCGPAGTRQTVHSFFDIDTSYDIKLEKDSAKWQAIQRADAIIIDEISMLNDIMLNRINEILNAVMNRSLDIIFGGKTVILIGDFFQLPAVSTPLFPVEPLFMSPLFTENFTPFLMKTNFRQQSDPEFQQFLNNCRMGTLNESDEKFITKRICGLGHSITDDYNDISNSTNLCSLHVCRKETVGRINKQKSRQFVPKIIESIDIDSVGCSLSEFLRTRIDGVQGTLERELELYQDTKLMVVKNVDMASGVVNGLVGNYSDSSERNLKLMKRLRTVFILFSDENTHRSLHPLMGIAIFIWSDCVYLAFKNEYLDLIKKEIDLSGQNYNKEKFSLKKYCEILLSARRSGFWGNEYHLSALVTGLNTNIYIYSEVKTNRTYETIHQLLEEFNSRPINICHSLVYKPITATKTTKFICGFYDTRIIHKGTNKTVSAHYTAILPHSHYSKEFKPINNLLSI
ncbi:DNA helicase ATP [Brachionus plicatilis]|uniref:ATP-dependent DNA helicase n=1 Tax=Brachionus plicatilis TaxID=10195 RepID=A0A3M7RT14_BRAPC|nr:DNA helicase ATP [Brachionus plicatilis]